MIDNSYELVFIDDGSNALLDAAYSAVSVYENLSPRRISPIQAINEYKTTPSKQTCFIISAFEGECYDHLCSLDSIIYGPQIILSYLRENKSLPKVGHPLFSTALRGAIVTVTSVTGQERENLFRSIKILHGTPFRDLIDEVNVIITPKVGSKKYIVGASRGIHIVLPTWLNEAWKLSSVNDPIDMMAPVYLEKFKVPIFSKLFVCVSGLADEERKEVADLVTRNGGEYSGSMMVGKTTHLIIKHASGVKYTHAKKWKIQIVSINWLVDSINRGYSLDEESYRVCENSGKSSTPTRNLSQCSISFNNISAIPVLNNCTTRVEETRSSDPFITSKQDVMPLSGCTISLHNCNQDETNECLSIANKLGGKICRNITESISENVTHAVYGTSQTTPKPNVENGLLNVNITWLFECGKKLSHIPEADHLLKHAPVDKDTTFKQNASGGAVNNDELNLINQYFVSDGAEDADFGLDQPRNTDATLSNVKLSDNFSALTTGPFSGHVFFLHLISSSDELSKSIISNGGSVCQIASDADVLVAPFFVCELPKVREECKLVSIAWIQHCLTNGSLLWNLLNEEPACIPLKRSGQLPLSKCVLSLSGFVGFDRTLLSSYAKALGAVVQECFLHKAAPSRNLAASTHLIASGPEGRKWMASQQWRIPAVKRQWLYACAEEWRRVDEKKFELKAASLQNTTSDPNKDKSITNNDLQHNLKSISVNNDSNATSNVMTTPNQRVVPAEHSIVDAMRTPDWVLTKPTERSTDSMGRRFKPSPPVSDQVSRCLKRAVSVMEALPKRKLELSDEEADVAPLNGVVICVAKHLSDQQVELNSLAKRLGADFKWSYDPHICTHIIAQRLPSLSTTTDKSISNNNNDLLSDVILAQSDRKSVVTPDWLTSCQSTSRRLPERQFFLSPTNDDNRPPSEDAQPPVKQPRLALATNLLGDVNRRLELMIGSSSVNSSNNNTALLPVIGDQEGSRSATRSPLDNPFPSPSDNESSLSAAPANPLASSASNGHETGRGQVRRLRRAATRQPSGSGSTPTTSNNNGVNAGHHSGTGSLTTTNDGGGGNDNSENVPDMLQLGQALQVRWQYEDATTTSTASTSCHTPASSTASSSSTTATLPVPSPTISSSRSTTTPTSSTAQSSTADKPTTPSVARTPSITTTTKSSAAVNSPRPARIFAFSGLPVEERDQYASIVQQLGGSIDDQLAMNSATSHLIVHTPTRSEKCLVCLATGKWMLHKSYLDACRRESRWVDEQAYEWGGPGTEPLLVQLSPACPNPVERNQRIGQIRDLARSARRWRLNGGSAFSGWRVVFAQGCDKEASFRRVIEAGDGQVLATGPPYPSAGQVTHAFYKRRPVTGSHALPANYEWLRIDYLCAFLTSVSEVSRAEYALKNDV